MRRITTKKLTLYNLLVFFSRSCAGAAPGQFVLHDEGQQGCLRGGVEAVFGPAVLARRAEDVDWIVPREQGYQVSFAG